MSELDLHRFELYQKYSTTVLKGDIEWRLSSFLYSEAIKHYHSSIKYSTVTH